MKTKVKVFNFHLTKIGDLVKYSKHGKNLHGKVNKKKIGIITGYDFFSDGDFRTICWPIVHFEGDSVGSHNHPINVIPFRGKPDKSQFVEMTL